MLATPHITNNANSPEAVTLPTAQISQNIDTGRNFSELCREKLTDHITAIISADVRDKGIR